MPEGHEGTGRWFTYEDAGHMVLGAYTKMPGVSPVSMFWPGVVRNSEHLRDFFMSAADHVSRNRHRKVAVYTTVAQLGGGRQISHDSYNVVHIPSTQDVSFLRFELVLRPEPNESEPDTPDFIAWASLLPHKDEVDSIGVYAAVSDLKAVGESLALFVAETSPSHPSGDTILWKLSHLEKQLATVAH